MQDKNRTPKNGNQHPLKQNNGKPDKSTSPNTPQQGKVENVNDDTKLENDSDSGDLNDDD